MSERETLGVAKPRYSLFSVKFSRYRETFASNLKFSENKSENKRFSRLQRALSFVAGILQLRVANIASHKLILILIPFKTWKQR